MHIKLKFKETDQHISVSFKDIISIGGSGERLPDYKGETVVLPSFENQTLLTKDNSMTENIEILPIKVTSVSNPSGGKTISI